MEGDASRHPAHRQLRARQRRDRHLRGFQPDGQSLQRRRAANTLAESTVDAIARLTKLSWSTAFRFLETLESSGYMIRSESGLNRPALLARSLGEGYAR
ncbi:Fic family protein [Azospirillum lipoferum]|uniref:helix-turn-helix domain-containing protein n=1 Tax=Azospirillum TaxID=191 RepID=UPI0014795FDD|nr:MULTISPECIES: helix-turn-helix domain-containing protein [Azospirillum]MCP1610981.1 Fic family protein [Azospirillum lipoferum]MDW5533886.1 helix-turn-helix domain-containing protein [Azospirillum sp. NL1]